MDPRRAALLATRVEGRAVVDLRREAVAVAAEVVAEALPVEDLVPADSVVVAAAEADLAEERARTAGIRLLSAYKH